MALDIYYKIVLRYSDTPITSLDYDSGATNQAEFECTFISPPIKSVVQDSGRLLNGRGYSHKLYATTEYDVDISANDLNNQTDIDYIQNWWISPYKYAIFYKTGQLSTYDYVEVMTDGGRCPFEFMENIVMLPEVKFKLYAK